MELAALNLLKKQKITRVFNYLGRIDSLHSGGCGVSALVFYEWLKIRGREKNFKVMFCYNGLDCFYDHNMEILERKNNGVKTRSPFQAPAHVVFSIDGGNIWTDAYGGKQTIDELEYDYVDIHEVTIDELRKSLTRERGTWNTYFNRDHYVPKIEKNLNVSLNLNV
jgi:hypothetical protein